MNYENDPHRCKHGVEIAMEHCLACEDGEDSFEEPELEDLSNEELARLEQITSAFGSYNIAILCLIAEVKRWRKFAEYAAAKVDNVFRRPQSELTDEDKAKILKSLNDPDPGDYDPS